MRRSILLGAAVPFFFAMLIASCSLINAPDDVQSVARWVLAHRLVLNFEAEAEGIDPDKVLSEILQKVPEKADEVKVA